MNKIIIGIIAVVCLFLISSLSGCIDLPFANRTITYYFNGYDNNEKWLIAPSQMIDGNHMSYAATSTDGAVELLDSNNCPGTDLGTITKVELRTYGNYVIDTTHEIILRSVFVNGDGNNHVFDVTGAEWSSWYDITTDTNAPSTWSWNDIQNLNCDVEANLVGAWVYCSIVEIRVLYH